MSRQRQSLATHIVQQTERNFFDVTLPLTRRLDWEHWLLIRGCAHFDAPDSNRELQKEHLELALKRNALIVDIGDLFDVVNSTWDKRAAKNTIRREHCHRDHLDRIVEDAVEFYSPYARNWVFAGMGNHEFKVLDVAGTNLTERLIAGMNRAGGKLYNGWYSGNTRFRFVDGSARHAINLKYAHGSGSGAGTARHKDRAVAYPDAHIVVSAHNHQAHAQEFARERISDTGKIYYDRQVHLKTPTYKGDYNGGVEGWHAERDGGPRVYGAWWIRFHYRKVRKPDSGLHDARVDFDYIRAT